MKTKWSSKVLTSVLAVSLAFSTASFAHAQSSDSKKTEQTKVQKEEKSFKKKVVVKSTVGKTVEKRLNSVDSSIENITKSINLYFGVTEDGIVDKELSKKTASKKYNSYKGKLKADINKLRAIDKQLASYKKKHKVNTAEFDALAAKSKELQKVAADEIKRVKDLAAQASTPKAESEKTNTTGDKTVPTQPEQTTTAKPVA